MTGQPQLTNPPPAPVFPPGFFVDMTKLTVRQLGVETTIVRVSLPIDVSATLQAFGFALAVAASVTYTITYFFESFGPGAEGTLGNVPGNLNSGGIPSPTNIGATEWNDTTIPPTTYTIPANTLVAGQTIKITAIASLGTGGFFGNGSAFVEGPVIQTQA